MRLPPPVGAPRRQRNLCCYSGLAWKDVGGKTSKLSGALERAELLSPGTGPSQQGGYRVGSWWVWGSVGDAAGPQVPSHSMQSPVSFTAGSGVLTDDAVFLCAHAVARCRTWLLFLPAPGQSLGLWVLKRAGPSKSGVGADSVVRIFVTHPFLPGKARDSLWVTLGSVSPLWTQFPHRKLSTLGRRPSKSISGLKCYVCHELFLRRVLQT